VNTQETDRLFFSGLAILISTVGLSGFWFTYFGPIAIGSYAPAGFPLHVHGWSFFLWLILFPLQPILIGRQKYSLHKTLGKFSAVLVLVMTLTGVLVLSVRAEEAARNGEPLVWLLYGPLFLGILVLFVTFYGLAIRTALKGRHQAHKRLLIVASSVAVAAGVARWVMVISGFHPLSIPVGVLACSFFLLIGVVYDAVTRRSVHPAYWAGIAAFIFILIPLFPQVSEDNVAWVNQWLAVLGEQLGFLYSPEPTVEFD
jgi:hypothetical protein